MNIVYFLALFSACFASDLNYAPKIENPESEKPLVLIVCSYNNENYYEGNLDSIFCQEYENYRVIYVNDASTDNTGELVQEYIANHDLYDKVTYIKNEKNQKAMANTYWAVHSCSNDEIVLIVDGDDRLYGTSALQIINQSYHNDEVWFTYGQSKKGFENIWWSKTGCSKPMEVATLKQGLHRSISYRWSHLRTFYAGLFKKIPKHRFMYEGLFFDTGHDVPVVLNLMDLAREHTFFVKDILYEYNNRNPICDHKVRKDRQRFISKYCFAQKPLPFHCKRREEFL